MPFSFLIHIFIGLLLSQLSFAAACPASTTSGIGAGASCTVTGTASTIQLNLNSGFTDSTAIAAVGGNNGLTVGARRALSFIKAAEILADQVVSSQVIVVDADFMALSCDATSATLGSAGAATNIGNVNPMPGTALINTFYPIGLINALGNTDYAGGTSDITSQFNSNIGDVGCLQSSNGWYYGFDSPPTNYIGFTTVLLHEMTHGLGFSSLVNASSGVKPSGIDDIFSNFLYSAQYNADWSIAGGLTDTQRQASAVSTTELLWNGANVNTAAEGLLTAGYDDADGSTSFTSGDRVEMYAPNPFEGGSSVSHFTTTASPNEIMEPQYTAGQLDLGLALYLLKDIGWTVTPNAVANTAPTITAIDQSTNEDVTKVVDASSWGADTDGDTLTFTVNSSCATNITCTINSNGTNLTMTPVANHNGGTHTITITISDGAGGSASDTFNLNVLAQNDEPVITGIPDQIIKVGEFKDITLSGYAMDIDGDGLTYSAVACGANLTCTFPSATTLRVTALAGLGTTVSVTAQVDDSNTGVSTDSFDVDIVTALPSTTIEVMGTPYNDGDTLTLPNESTQINVNNGTGNYSYELDYNSSDVDGLITENATGLTIGFPASGEFAGDYTLTIIDNSDGDVIIITVTRPLRLNWSTTSLLNGNTEQTLKIEGGAAGTVYSLTQSGPADLVFLDDGNNLITNATADNNPVTFNAAIIFLDSENVTAISNMDVTVQSSYDDVVETDVKVYPSSLHHFNVKDSSDDVLIDSFGELVDGNTLITAMNIATTYNADSNGEFTILLPDTTDFPVGTSFALQVSASGYNSENLILDSDITRHNIVLSEMSNGITLSVRITAGGNQNLLQNPPVVTLNYQDGSSDVLTVEVTSSLRANFDYEVDLNIKSLESLSVSQAESVTVNLNISNVTQSQSLDILLLNNSSVIVSTVPVDTTSGGGAGSFGFFSLFLLLMFQLQVMKLKVYKRIMVE